MIPVATWIAWLHLLAVTLWLGGAATLLLAILPAMREGGPVDAAVQRSRAALTVQLLLGAVAVLLGLGVRSV